MKISNTVFPLASCAQRAALITGIVAGTVCELEVVAAVAHDMQKREWKKPVVAENIRFDSVTAAARYIVKQNKPLLSKVDYFKAVQSEMKRVARMCTQDCWDGYYWSN